MNPPIFIVYKVEEDPQVFLDGVYRLLSAKGVTSRETAEFSSYQLRDISQIQYNKLKQNRPVDSANIEWEEFKEYCSW